MSNVTQLFPGGMSAEDCEVCETILLVLLNEQVAIRECELSTRPLAEIVVEQGEPTITSHGFRFKAYRWDCKLTAKRTLRQVVVDQGKYRILCYCAHSRRERVPMKGTFGPFRP